MTEQQKPFLLSTRVYNGTPGWTFRTIDINGTGLQNKSFQDRAEISKASVLVKRPVLADLSITLRPIRMHGA